MVWQDVLQAAHGLLMRQPLVNIQINIAVTWAYFFRMTFCSLEGSELLPQLQGKLIACLPKSWTQLKYELPSQALRTGQPRKKEKKSYFKPFNHIILFSFPYLITNYCIYLYSALEAF